MDVLMALLICVMGAVPPLLVGVWAYRQGIKGREEALELRDEAVAKVQLVRDQIDGLAKMISEIPVPVIPPFPEVVIPPFPTSIKLDEEQKKDLVQSIGQSVKAHLGSFVKSGMAEAEQMIEIEKKVQGVNPENFGTAILGKIMSKFLGD